MQDSRDVLGALAVEALARDLYGGPTDNREARRAATARNGWARPKAFTAKRKARRRMQAESRRRNRGR